MELNEKALSLHAKYKGKLEVISKIEVKDRETLALVYTPGVASPCKEIERDESLVYKYTSKSNTIAVVSDGTAVLGLGNIGPKASLPVMEGKCVLFKEFAGVNAFPICLSSQDIDEIVFLVKQISNGLGGINLEDISAPRCFEIQERLSQDLDIPVFHDDQQGTAIVVLAALINAFKLVEKNISEVKIIINGAGAAGISIGKLLLDAGAKDIIICDIGGIVNEKTFQGESYRPKFIKKTNPRGIRGSLKDAMEGADVFIGVSGPNAINQAMVASMAKDSIVLALANPIPEIYPHMAKKAGARIVGTGRSDFPNQVNNVLAFPGIFRGALDSGAKKISKNMILAAAYAIAGLIDEKDLNDENIIVGAFDKRIVDKLAEAVAQAAVEDGLIR